MKKSYCVSIGRVHIYYLIKPCFVLLCFEWANLACHLFFGYNWGRDLILRPGWQERNSAPCALCCTRLQMNDDTRRNLKRGSPIYRFIHLRLNVRAVSWQWSTPGGQHTGMRLRDSWEPWKNHPLLLPSRSLTDRNEVPGNSPVGKTAAEVESCILGPSLGPASISESLILWVLHTSEIFRNAFLAVRWINR